MGRTPDWLLEDWARQQRTDEAQKDRRTVVQLPCCGSSYEVTATQQGQEQWITCPNKLCRKRNLLTWGTNPTIQQERPRLSL